MAASEKKGQATKIDTAKQGYSQTTAPRDYPKGKKGGK